MNAEKRSVSTDALATLGTIITDGGRDAIHLAVEPVIAGERLFAGQHIGLKDGKAYSNPKVKELGIVDPFIMGPISEGQMFWLIVYPRQITSLRHVWAHPDFDKKEKKADVESEFHNAQQWIRDFSESIPLDYNVLMQGADDYVDSGDSLCFGGLLEGKYVPDEFWNHYEKVRGVKVELDERGSFFSCSC